MQTNTYTRNFADSIDASSIGASDIVLLNGNNIMLGVDDVPSTINPIASFDIVKGISATASADIARVNGMLDSMSGDYCLDSGSLSIITHVSQVDGKVTLMAKALTSADVDGLSNYVSSEVNRSSMSLQENLSSGFNFTYDHSSNMVSATVAGKTLAFSAADFTEARMLSTVNLVYIDDKPVLQLVFKTDDPGQFTIVPIDLLKVMPLYRGVNGIDIQYNSGAGKFYVSADNTVARMSDLDSKLNASGNIMLSSGSLAVDGGLSVRHGLALAGGQITTSGQNTAVAIGIGANATEEETFVWSATSNEAPYTSHGQHTFNVNPENGLSGFYVGEQTVVEAIGNYYYEKSETSSAAEVEAGDIASRLKSKTLISYNDGSMSAISIVGELSGEQIENIQYAESIIVASDVNSIVENAFYDAIRLSSIIFIGKTQSDAEQLIEGTSCPPHCIVSTWNDASQEWVNSQGYLTEISDGSITPAKLSLPLSAEISGKSDLTALTAHINDTGNPHNVTAAQISAVQFAGGLSAAGNFAVVTLDKNVKDSGRKASDFVLKNSNAISIGASSDASTSYATAIGANAKATAVRALAVGSTGNPNESTTAAADYSVALGPNAKVAAGSSSAVQIGSGTNTEAQTLKFRETTIIRNGALAAELLSAVALSSDVSAELDHKQDKLSDVQISAIDSVVNERATIVTYNDNTVSSYNIVGELASSSIDNISNAKKVDIGSTVTSIGNNAFYNCTNLTSVTIPNSVTSIGNSTFSSCSSLTSVTIGNSIKSIKTSTFYSCSNLASIVISDSVTSIGDWAFTNCTRLISMMIPDSVTSIMDGAFDNCSGLTSVMIGNGVTSIGSSTFQNCSGLTSMMIPNSVTSIGDWAFYGCSSLTSIIVKGKTQTEAEVLLTNANVPTGCQILTWNDASQEWVKEQGYLTEIGSDYKTYAATLSSLSADGYALLSDTNRVFIKDPSVAEYVDGKQSDLSVIKIPADEYQQLVVDNDVDPNTLYVISSDCINAYGQQIKNLSAGTDPDDAATYSQLLSCVGGVPLNDYWRKVETSSSVEISAALDTKQDSLVEDQLCALDNIASQLAANRKTTVLFRNGQLSTYSIEGEFLSSTIDGISSAVEIRFGNAVTSIGLYALQAKNYLKRVILADSISSISDNSISWCSNLTAVAFPNGLTAIPDSCCRNTPLYLLDIPSSVTRINGSAFYNCTKLIGINIQNPTMVVELVGSRIFDNTNDCPIYVLDNMYDAYMASSMWSAYHYRIRKLSDLYTFDNIVKISYADLVTLKTNSHLVPGQQYRITDYVATTNGEQAYYAGGYSASQSAGHQFDIIVVADSSSELNEVARAVLHDGDLPDDIIQNAGTANETRTKYFAGCNLAAWKVWYCLENDTSRFVWADTTNGKGVIYRLIDEFGNDVPYDFKGITFSRWSITGVEKAASASSVYNSILTSFSGFVSSSNGGIYASFTNSDYQVGSLVFKVDPASSKQYYTFDLGNGTDSSLNGSRNGVYNNVFAEFSMTSWSAQQKIMKSRLLNNAVVITSAADGEYYARDNSFGSTFCSTFIKDCQENKFAGCQNSLFYYTMTCNIGYANEIVLHSCSKNKIGNSCYSLLFGLQANRNTVADGCTYCTLMGQDNVLGEECSGNFISGNKNSFGSGCSSNVLSSSCILNAFGNDCSGNFFGYNCQSNSFGSNSSNNVLVSNISACTFGINCNGNALYNDCINIMLANGCSSNALVSAYGDNYQTSQQLNWKGYFDSSTQYNADDTVIYNSAQYRCTTSHYGNWDSADFELVKTLRQHAKNIVFEPNCSYIDILASTAGTLFTQYYQNVNVKSGVVGAVYGSRKTITDSSTGQAFNTEYKPVDSQVVLI